MESVIVYQRGKNFCMTRKRDIRTLDAEELIRELSDAREQLSELQGQIKEFERDIKIMEKFEDAAKNIREVDVKQAKIDRVNLVKKSTE